MSSRESPGGAEPFGFRFLGNEQDGAVTPSGLPPGPPLLNNVESNMLENFFQDPNSMDPSFLSNDYTRLGVPVFGSDDLHWMNDSRTEYGPLYSQTRQPFPAPSSDQGRSGYGNFSSVGGHINASDDVHEAARLLYNNHNGRHNGASTQQHENLPPSHHRRESDRHGAQYPYAQSASHIPYEMGTSSAYNLYYGTGCTTNGGQDYGKPSSARKESSTSSHVDTMGRPQSVTFGSDDKFRQTHYAAPLTKELPGKAGEKFLAGALTYGQDLSKSGSPSPAHSGDRKGPNLKEENGHVEGDDEDDSAEETPPPQKKRKRKSDEDDEDFGVKRGKPKTQKPRRSSSPGTSRRTSSIVDVNKRSQQFSPSDNKANRENLTEEQKRNNHIQSEQKRRNLIKNGFEDLTKMVPELRAGGFSKSNMLLEAAKFMKLLRDGNEQLEARIQSFEDG